MKKTKGYEPPDIHFLQKDFETCVLSGDIECQYIEGTDVEDYPGTQYGHSQSEKKLGVGDKYHRSIKVHT